jgi:hypothetical protein
MTDSGNHLFQWSPKSNAQKKSTSPLLPYVEESDHVTTSPLMLSDPLCSHAPGFDDDAAAPLLPPAKNNDFDDIKKEKKCLERPSLFEIHQKNKNKSMINDHFIPEPNCEKNQSRKRKAESASPNEIRTPLKSPGLAKIKPLNYHQQKNGDEREFIEYPDLKNAKKPKTMDSDKEHEVPSTPPLANYNDDSETAAPQEKTPLPSTLPASDEKSEHFIQWKSEMKKISDLNTQLSVELQAQLNFLVSMVIKTQNNFESHENQAAIIQAIERVNNGLEKRFVEFEHDLENSIENTNEEKVKNRQTIQHQCQLQQQQPANITPNSTDYLANPKQQEEEVSERSEDEFLELEERIDSLETELADSRRLINLLGTKVLEMERKVENRN